MVKKMILRLWICKNRGMRNVRCLSSVSGSNESRPRWTPVVESGEAELVGYSHGWGAMFNKRNHHLFLMHPTSGEKVKLPPYDTLSDAEENLDLEGQGSVSKVILSDGCGAMMTFGPFNRLAFCLPGRSSKWTPIGEPYFEHDLHYPYRSFARVHEDLVYCSRRGVFTSITACDLKLYDFVKGAHYFCFERLEGYVAPPEGYDWDIEDPDAPELVRSWPLYVLQNGSLRYGKGRRTLLWVEENIELLATECVQIPHLVYAEESDQLFLVLRFVRLMSGGGSPLGCVPLCDIRGGLSGTFTGKTCGFIVFEADTGIMVDHLNGMTMFVGIHHSRAFRDPDLFNPDSIYFTDAKRITNLCGISDTGVFNYATKTFSN